LLSVWFFSTGFQFQPSRPEDTAGWQQVDLGGGYTRIGQFVLSKGQSTDNGEIGVKLIKITSKPCPFATICLVPEASATLRFYRAADQTEICETTLAADSTGYVTKVVCPGLPFSIIHVYTINTSQEWAMITFSDDGNARRDK